MQRFPHFVRYIFRKVVSDLNTLKPCNELESAIKRYGHGVESLAFLYLRNKYDAEDIAQDVFFTYFRKAPFFLSAQKEKAWLMRVAANRCISVLREPYRKEVPLTDDLPELSKEEGDVLQAVLQLEEKYRIPIHLHYYEGYSLKEISKTMGVPYGTVGSYLSRGREQLRQILKEDYFEE